MLTTFPQKARDRKADILGISLCILLGISIIGWLVLFGLLVAA